MGMTDIDHFRRLFLIIFFTCIFTLVSNLLPYPVSADERQSNAATPRQASHSKEKTHNSEDIQRLIEVQDKCLKNYEYKGKDSIEAVMKCLEPVLPTYLEIVDECSKKNMNKGKDSYAAHGECLEPVSPILSFMAEALPKFMSECSQENRNKKKDSYGEEYKCLEPVLPLMQRQNLMVQNHMAKMTKSDFNHTMKSAFKLIEKNTLLLPQGVNPFFSQEERSAAIYSMIRDSGQDPAKVGNAFDSVLVLKGYKTKLTKHMHETFSPTLPANASPEAREVHQRLLAAQDDFFRSIPQNMQFLAPPEEHRKRVKSSREKEDKVEKLRKQFERLTKSEQNYRVTHVMLADKLPSGTALIEFVKIYHVANNTIKPLNQMLMEETMKDAQLQALQSLQDSPHLKDLQKLQSSANLKEMNKGELLQELQKLQHSVISKEKLVKDELRQKLKNLQGVADLKEKLRKGELLPELQKRQRSAISKEKLKKGETARENYVAFILRAGRPDTIRFVDLGDASPIDRNIAELKKEMNNSGKDADLHFAKSLYEQIFKPIREELGDVNKIFITPDGNLNLIPFEILQLPDGRFLIEEYTFNYLTLSDDLLTFGKEPKNTGKIVLIGDPDFDLSREEKRRVLASLGKKEEEFGYLSEMDKKSPEEKRTIKQIKSELPPFGNLPETKIEIESIQKLLGERKTDIYADQSALEEVLLSVRSPAILHLATHGFFLDDRHLVRKGDGRGVGGIQKIETKPSKEKTGLQNIETSLARSGIALAGANHALKSDDADVSDGLVTADKILGMRLEGTDMVVLSACQTGLGEVQTGEGVFGLQKAFRGARAKSMVVSMWKVPDDGTRKLMVKFYQNMFTEKMDRCQALRQAALACMKELRQQGVANPLFWGGFIFIGNPT